MKRKVIQIAGSTQLVSIPRKWALRYGVSKGDELEVLEQANRIIISTDKDLATSNISIDTRKLNLNVVKWLLVSLYKGGYDEVELIFEEPEIIHQIQSLMGELLGFVVIEQTKNKCVIRNISKGVEEEFDHTFRRNFLVVLSLAKNTFEMLRDGHYKNLADVARLEKTNNQLTAFCHRILNKRGFKDLRKTSYMYVIIKLLEGAADKYREICNYVSDQKRKKYKPSREIIGFFEDVNRMLDTYYQLFYNFDDSKIVAISASKKELTVQALKMMKGADADNIFMLFNLVGVVENIGESMGSYLGTHF